MNSLSWLLYLADVCDTLDTFFIVCAMFCGIGSVASIFAVVITKMYSDDKEAREAHGAFRALLKWVAPIFTVASILAAATPEKETFYAIAASELGEQVLASKTVGKARLALDAWLDKQIGTAPAVEQK